MELHRGIRPRLEPGKVVSSLQLDIAAPSRGMYEAIQQRSGLVRSQTPTQPLRGTRRVERTNARHATARRGPIYATDWARVPVQMWLYGRGYSGRRLRIFQNLNDRPRTVPVSTRVLDCVCVCLCVCACVRACARRPSLGAFGRVDGRLFGFVRHEKALQHNVMHPTMQHNL